MKPLRKAGKVKLKIILIMLESFLLPVFVCVVLPVAIVWIVGRTRQNETNRKTEVMLKAIESGAQIDPNMFKSREKPVKSLKERLLEKLSGACVTSLMGIAFLTMAFINSYNPGLLNGVPLRSWMPVAGCILLAVGVGLFISYFTGKSMLADEMEAEENARK